MEGWFGEPSRQLGIGPCRSLVAEPDLIATTGKSRTLVGYAKHPPGLFAVVVGAFFLIFAPFALSVAVGGTPHRRLIFEA